jgi:hypothetical protein
MPSQPYEEWSNDLLLHPLTTTNLVYPYYYQITKDRDSSGTVQIAFSRKKVGSS